MSRSRRSSSSWRVGRAARAAGCVLLASSLLALPPPPPTSAHIAEAKPALAVALESSLPDVGAAASLAAAGTADAVVFTASPGSLGDAAARLVRSQQPARILIVGGTAAVSDAVETELRGIASGASFERLAGRDRIHTAALAASRILDDRNDGRALSVIIADGWSLPDVGAAASAVAAGIADAVLYTAPGSLSDHTAQALGRFEPSDIVIAGGTAAVSTAAENAAVAAANRANARRIGGATRTHTAALIAQYAYPASGAGPDTLVVADGWSPIDVGIAASLAAALGNAAVIYTNGYSLDDTTAQFVAAHQPRHVYFVSTSANVPASSRTRLDQALPGDLTLVTNATASAYLALGLEAPTARVTAPVAPAVSLSSTHGCQLDTSGVISCWGDNTHGQAMPPAGAYSYISVGTDYSCAIRSDQALACWGDNTDGRTDPPAGAFTAIAAGPLHPCAISADGAIACWGRSNVSYPGGGATDRPPSGTFTDIALTGQAACAITTAKTIRCWGFTEARRGLGASPQGEFDAIAVTYRRACAIRTSGAIACWGQGAEQLHDAPAGSHIAIAAGGRGHDSGYTCALRTDLAVNCWGSDTASIPSSTGSEPTAVTGLTDPPAGRFQALAAASHQACAIDLNGRRTCWGSDAAQADAGTDTAKPEAVVSPTHLVITEGDNGTYSIRLSAEPAEPVTVEIGIPTSSAVTVDTASLTFTDSNWHQPQSIRVTASDDNNQADEAVTITHTATMATEPPQSLTFPDVTVTVKDDDAPRASATEQPKPPAAHDTSTAALPAGYQFQSITAGDKHTCALYGQWVGSSIICWGDNADGKLDAPGGEFTAIAAGYDHTCALRTDRTVACWGANDVEQTDAPRQAGGWRREQFAAGFKHTCVRRSSDLICWGSGEASRQYESLPLTFRGLSGGNEHYCGLNDDYAIECVGDNSFGQLDAPSGAYRSIAAGARHSCASFPSQGDAVCWGDNAHGQTDIPDASMGRLGFVAAGDAHSCATPQVTGPIVCWGSDAQGQLRAPTDASAYYHAIAAGSRHTCAIPSSGLEIVCWGDNRHSQSDAPALPRPATDDKGGTDPSGDSPTLTAEFASLVQGLTPASPQSPTWSGFSPDIDAPGGPFVQVAAGEGVCGLRDDHSLDCWWDDGELIAAVPSGKFSSFEASGRYGCAIRQLNGSLACWGRDELRDNRPTGAFSKVSVSQHGSVACAIRTSGRLECWDGNPFGRVSRVVDPANQGGWGQYSMSATYAEVSVSEQTACAVRTDGTLDCWGYRLWASPLPQDVRAVSVGGERGICALKHDSSIVCMSYNTSSTSEAPQWREGPAGEYRSVSVGTGFACAVTTAGAARCWLLDGNPGYSSYPTRTHGRHPESFAPPSGVFQTVRASRISAPSRTCGLRSDGSIMCWGTRLSSSIDITASVGAIAGGSDFTCGLRQDATISCWGANWFGQTDAPSGRFTSVTAGRWHACAIRPDRTLTCWGYNQHGQTDAPSGTFSQVVAAGSYSCGLRTDTSVTCWGSNYSHALDTPDGSFAKIAVSGAEGGWSSDLGTTCGLRTDGRVTCWGGTRTAGTVAGTGASLATASKTTPFVDFDISPGYWCAVRGDGIVSCDGFSCGSGFFAPAPSHHCYTDANSQVHCEAPRDDPFSQVLITRFGACASTEDGRWTCFGEGVHEYWPPGASDVSPPGHLGCARRSDGTWTCNGTLGPTVWDPFDPETVTFS